MTFLEDILFGVLLNLILMSKSVSFQVNSNLGQRQGAQSVIGFVSKDFRVFVPYNAISECF